MSYQYGLYKFRKARGLEDDLGDVVTNILDEIVEVRKAIANDDLMNLIEELTDICVFSENALAQMKAPLVELDFQVLDLTINRVLMDITVDIARFDTDRSPHTFRHIIRKIMLYIEGLGFDFDKCMEQTVKKISSRKGAMNEAGTKWERDKYQDPNELYTPNYQLCKRIV